MAVNGLSSAVSLGLGGTYTCALLADGTVSCWGRSYNLGQAAEADATTPLPVPGLADVTSIAAGEDHTCVTLASGAVRCWSSNGSGRLGLGPFTPFSPTRSATPVSPAW